MTPILHRHVDFLPWMDPATRRLPGVVPLPGDDWLRVDEAFAGQMAERDRLIAGRMGDVHALMPRGGPAAAELLVMVLDCLRSRPDYRFAGGEVTRPDGVSVPVDPAMPLLSLGRLVQEDLCLLESDGAEHVLTGAILCFPASWTLSQKIGRPLTAIHDPVVPYDEGIARRVQRMFDAVRPGHPLHRGNSLFYDDATLFQPRFEGQRRPRPVARSFVRIERQCLVRLPVSRAVVFSIHSYVIRSVDLPDAALAALAALHP